MSTCSRRSALTPRLAAPVALELTPEVACPRQQPVARQPLAPRERLQFTHLLERVDADVRVRADRQRHAGVAVAQGGQEAVTEVGLGGRAGSDDRAAARQACDIAVTDVDGVHDRRSRAQESVRVEQLERRAAVLGLALLELERLLLCVHMPDQIVRLRVLGDACQPGGGNRADRVRRDSDTHPVLARGPGAQVIDPLQERVDVGVAEAPLTGRRLHVRPVTPAVAVVGGWQQHDLDARLLRGMRNRDRHRVGLRVRPAIGLVMDVVELADGAVTRPHHLRVDGERDRVHRVRVEPGDRVEHRGPPAPEVVVRGGAWPLRDPAQVALERVRVHIDHRRDLGSRRRAHAVTSAKRHA